MALCCNGAGNAIVMKQIHTRIHVCTPTEKSDENDQRKISAVRVCSGHGSPENQRILVVGYSK